jgi:hypothetical protein
VSLTEPNGLQVILYLFIDDGYKVNGVVSRGHRENMQNVSTAYMGCFSGPINGKE